ncbi:glycine receptor subunit alpha-2-like isoform X1 [Petromyzon marinus]|uniref:glycine receptor subunit alpha-2-like isoform X1 n=1 Tax=Petromyzon marinus TaxID=7757 RepID=UPI003F6FD9CE
MAARGLHSAVVAWLIFCPLIILVDGTFLAMNNVSLDKGYERRLRPNINGVPVVVTCSMIIKRFGPVQETSMDYQTSIILQMRWNDPRLQNIFTPTSKNSYDLGNNYIDSIWKPCLFFENEKMASAHAIIADNKMLRLFRNGDVFYTMRLTMSLECTMTLNDYPMDSQKCHMNLESYGYTTNDVILQWNDTNPIVFNTSHIVTTFTVYEDGKLGNCTQTYGTGTFSCISLEITLSRDIGYNLIQIYIPSMLLVIISWFSFWIDMSAAPARAGLGITTILTITTQSSAANAQLPKVSYIKAIDVWMGMCQVFAFAALLEFAAVNVMARQNKRAMKELKKKSDGSKEMPDEQELKNTFVTQAHTIDRISRIVFPTTFLILNIFYWVFYKVVLKFR